MISSSAISRYEEELFDFEVEPSCHQFPSSMTPKSRRTHGAARLCSYPHDAAAVRRWLLELYLPRQTVRTPNFLDKLNTHIFETFQYENREASGAASLRNFWPLGQRLLPRFPHGAYDGGGEIVPGFAARFVSRLNPDGRRDSMVPLHG